MADTESPVRYERDGRVAYLTLNRPDKLNAFSDASVIALREALYRFDRDDEAWVAVLHGAGRAFSSGADVHQRQLREREELVALGGPSGKDATHHPILYEGFLHWKPIIAAVHGYVMGMALGLALRCELIVADESTTFQATEVSRGLYGGPYWSVMQFRGAGSFADEVFMTGRSFSAAEAGERGVINRVVADGEHLSAAADYAEEILRNPPLAVRAVVRARRLHLQRHESLHPLINEGWKLHLTDDFRQSALAFAEKRERPEFRGE